MIRRYPELGFLYVVGGGRVARDYIEAARKYGIDNRGQDMLGIAATRLNALLVELALKKAGIEVIFIENIKDTRRLEQYQVIVTGGTEPGHTTDIVAVQYAAMFGCNWMINITQVGGVYDEDPTKHPDAKLVYAIKGSEIVERWGTSHQPGMNLPIEPRAVEVARRHGISICIIGPDIRDLEDAILNRRCKGTLVIPE
jgi:uridylate kinase